MALVLFIFNVTFTELFCSLIFKILYMSHNYYRHQTALVTFWWWVHCTCSLLGGYLTSASPTIFTAILIPMKFISIRYLICLPLRADSFADQVSVQTQPLSFKFIHSV